MGAMEDYVDLYELLGLTPGADGAEIKKAYRKRALELHPDKRPNDATAADQFARLQHAYEVLSDEKARKAFDELQQLRKAREEKQRQMSAKRRKMVDELNQREVAFGLQRKEKAAEDNAARRLQEEIARIRAKNAQQKNSNSTSSKASSSGAAKPDSLLSEQDREKTLKVTWDSTIKPGYDSQRLREIFERFGGVGDVLITQKKSKSTALVVMESASAAHAATQVQCGDISNPLLVVSMALPSKAPAPPGDAPQEARQPESKPQEQSPPPPSESLAGSGFQSLENSVLQKLRKAQQEKNRKMNEQYVT